MAVVYLKRDYERCVAEGTPKEVCLTSIIDRLIADEQLAQREYSDLLDILPPKPEYLKTVAKIKADEQEHQRMLEELKADIELTKPRPRFKWAGTIT